MPSSHSPKINSDILLRPIGWRYTLILFSLASLLLFFGTHILIPLFSQKYALEPVVFWFLFGSLVVFLPLLIAAYILLRRESGESLRARLSNRLRFQPLNAGDWLWGLGALIFIIVLTLILQWALTAILGDKANLQPSFMTFEPVTSGRYWILLIWLPFWVLNIMSEEVLWRGVILPRQEVALGRHAWLANSIGWCIFHLAFGWQILVVLIPILFILPYVTQRRQNSSIAVLIHAGINGPGFIAVAFGYA